MKRRNCSEALSAGLDRETCHNFRGVRQWVMCRAWRKEREGVPFGQAISDSWKEAVEQCRAVGGSPKMEEMPQKVEVAHLIDRETGREEGKVVLTDDREVTVCFGQTCTTTHGDRRLYYIAQAFFDQLGYNIREEE